MSNLITLTKVGIFDQNGSRFTVTEETIRVDQNNLSSVETDDSGSIVMLNNKQALDGGFITGYVVSETPAEIQTLIDTTASTLAASDGTVGAPSIAFSGDTDSGIYRIGANNIGVGVNGAKVLDVATTGLGITGALSATTTVTVGTKLITAGIETIAGGGTTTALSLTKTVHSIDADAGGDIFTLADGVIGQIMTIALLSSTGVATVTPANLAGGTSVTMAAAGDTVMLQFVDTNWYIIGGNGYTVI